jgi:hypothetical protein
MKQKTKDRIKEELKDTKEGVKDEISDFFCYEPFRGMGCIGVGLYIILLPLIILWIIIRTIFRMIFD